MQSDRRCLPGCGYHCSLVTELFKWADARTVFVASVAFGLLGVVSGCRTSAEESDRKQVDVPVLEALATPEVAGSVELLSTELEAPVCSFDCPAPARFWFYGCNSCRSDVEKSVTAMQEQLVADGWEAVPAGTGDGTATFVRKEPSSRTGEVRLQILWAHGQGLIRDNPNVVIDGTESEIWVRAATESFDA